MAQPLLSTPGQSNHLLKEHPAQGLWAGDAQMASLGKMNATHGQNQICQHNLPLPA